MPTVQLLLLSPAVKSHHADRTALLLLSPAVKSHHADRAALLFLSPAVKSHHADRAAPLLLSPAFTVSCHVARTALLLFFLAVKSPAMPTVQLCYCSLRLFQSPTMPTGKYFYIQSKVNGLVLDIQGGSSDPGTKVITWDKKDEDNHNQLWCEEHMSGTIRSKLKEDLCLEINGMDSLQDNQWYISRIEDMLVMGGYSTNIHVEQYIAFNKLTSVK